MRIRAIMAIGLTCGMLGGAAALALIADRAPAPAGVAARP